MEHLTQTELAMHEKVEPPRIEKSNFRYSFSFLPKDERSAINSVYAFCSYIDDIVDSTPTPNQTVLAKKMARLDWWEKEIDMLYKDRPSGHMLKPFIAMIERFNIPKQYFLTLIDGCRRDLIQYRYDTFDELKDYCYSVASAVGLISIEIFGYNYEETRNYAINLGYALQLTNILRDIKTDKERGYIYLPREDMERFGVSESQVINEVYNDNFVDLMRFEAGRARAFYHTARKHLRPDERPRLFAAEIMDAIYYRLLDKIELNDFNVFKKKVRVSAVHKLLIAMKHWLSITLFVNRLRKNEYS